MKSSPCCPHCGASLEVPAKVEAPQQGPFRYELEELVSLAERDRTYDQAVKVRASQDDIRKFISKRKGTRP